MWARAEATKRGFGPDTTKTVQIVVDGAKGLESNLAPLFPKAIVTLDVIHVVEKLWSLAHHFHKEGSEELKAWVEELKTLLYQGKAKTIVERLRRWVRQAPRNGPGRVPGNGPENGLPNAPAKRFGRTRSAPGTMMPRHPAIRE